MEKQSYPGRAFKSEALNAPGTSTRLERLQVTLTDQLGPCGAIPWVGVGVGGDTAGRSRCASHVVEILSGSW